MNERSITFQNKTYKQNNNQLRSRPLSSIIFHHNRPSFRTEISSSLSRRRQNYDSTNRMIPSDRNNRKIRSASLYQTVHKRQKHFKIQILNNNCFKRIYEEDGKTFKKQDHLIHITNFFPQNMLVSQTFQFRKSSYLCKPLKVCKDQHRLSISFLNNQIKQSMHKSGSTSLNVGVVGNRMF